jgi:hypothetical protein
MGFISGELRFSGVVYSSLGVEGGGTPNVYSGGWGSSYRAENFTYAVPIRYNIIKRCNSATLS